MRSLQVLLGFMHGARSAAGSALRPQSQVNSSPCGPDFPISMPEMIMASAFLDFGSIADERFMHEWQRRFGRFGE